MAKFNLPYLSISVRRRLTWWAPLSLDSNMASHSSKNRMASLILDSRKINLKLSSAFMTPSEGKLIKSTWCSTVSFHTPHPLLIPLPSCWACLPEHLPSWSSLSLGDHETASQFQLRMWWRHPNPSSYDSVYNCQNCWLCQGWGPFAPWEESPNDKVCGEKSIAISTMRSEGSLHIQTLSLGSKGEIPPPPLRTLCPGQHRSPAFCDPPQPKIYQSIIITSYKNNRSTYSSTRRVSWDIRIVHNHHSLTDQSGTLVEVLAMLDLVLKACTHQL